MDDSGTGKYDSNCLRAGGIAGELTETSNIYNSLNYCHSIIARNTDDGGELFIENAGSMAAWVGADCIVMKSANVLLAHYEGYSLNYVYGGKDDRAIVGDNESGTVLSKYAGGLDDDGLMTITAVPGDLANVLKDNIVRVSQ